MARPKEVCGRDEIKRAVVKLSKSGELFRAVRILTSSGLAPVTKETVEKLASKHPERASALTDVASDDECIALSMQLFLHKIQNLLEAQAGVINI